MCAKRLFNGTCLTSVTSPLHIGEPTVGRKQNGFKRLVYLRESLSPFRRKANRKELIYYRPSRSTEFESTVIHQLVHFSDSLFMQHSWAGSRPANNGFHSLEGTHFNVS